MNTGEVLGKGTKYSISELEKAEGKVGWRRRRGS